MKNLKDFNELINILKFTGLFREFQANELESILGCIGAGTQSYKKGKIILLAGDTPKFAGIVLSGQLHIIRESYDGNRSLIASLAQGDIFGEALCCAGVLESPVTVIAAADSVFMPLDFSRILRACPNSCVFHGKLIENLLTLVAKKNLFLQSRMEILSSKSVRARVMLYLESFIQNPGTKKRGGSIKIPLNREEMANFLCVERSALSHELMKMKKDGMIDYKKNIFTINMPRSGGRSKMTASV